MQPSWLVVIPPFIVIILAFVTRKILSSLFFGILAALLILHNFAFTDSCFDFVVRIWRISQLDALSSIHAFWSAWYLFIILFLFMVGIIIMMISYSGGASAYGKFVLKYLKNSRDAEAATLLLSSFFIVDDYLSSISVGSVMQTVADKFYVPRAKLALLVNSMAAPLSVIVPVSSWVAEITTQLSRSGVSSVPDSSLLVLEDPFLLYTATIPYIFYSFAVVMVMWFIVLRRVSYGPLYKHEEIAVRTGNLFAGKTPVANRTRDISLDQQEKSSLADFLVPIGSLFCSVGIAIIYFGNCWIFGGNNSFLNSLRNTKIAQALFVAGVITVIVSMFFLLARRRITVVQLPNIFLDGIRLMLSSVVVLLFVWTLSDLLKNDLATGHYLASFFLGAVNISFLPAMFFVLTAITTTLMGSAWGAMGIYIPIALPMLVTLSGFQSPVTVTMLPIIIPLLGAIISGAVVGNHLSPIADNTMMSATSSGAYVIDLIKSQASFSIPVACITGLGYLLAGYMISAGYSLRGTALLCVCFIVLLCCIYFSLMQILKRKKIL